MHLKHNLPKLMEVLRAVVRGKFIAINAYVKKKKDLKSITYPCTFRGKN